MSKVTVRVDWHMIRGAGIAAVVLGSIVVTAFIIAGIAKGLPFPPTRWDDFTFATVIMGVVCPLGWFLWFVGSDFMRAWRAAHAIEAEPVNFTEPKRVARRAASDRTLPSGRS